MSFTYSLLEVLVSDITGILQVVLAVFSIVADIILAFLAAKINDRSKKTHINQVIESTKNVEDNQAQQPSQSQNTEKEIKVEKQLQKIVKNNKNGISVMKFIKLFKDICSEAKAVKILRSCKDCGISWNGLLSVDTIITINTANIKTLSTQIAGLI